MARKESLNKVRAHFKEVTKGNRNGSLEVEELSEGIHENFTDFAKSLIETRKGRLDKFGRPVKPKNVSLAQGLSFTYGIVAPEHDEYGKALTTRRAQEGWIIKQFLRSMDIYTGSDTLQTVVQRFGGSGLPLNSLYDVVENHTQFASGVSSTADFTPNDQWRFIIPELILAAIRVEFEATSMHNNWIGITHTLSQREVTMPQMKRGAAVPKKLEEGESIDFGTIQFGKKRVRLFKFGLGFALTDELIQESSLDMLFEFLAQIGNEMTICADYEAFRVLVNGDLSDGSESAPVVGVASVLSGLQYRDIKKVISQMKWLGRDPNRIITALDEGINIGELPEFRGFNGGTKLASLESMLGVPDRIMLDTYAVAANQCLLLDPTRAMAKLQYGGMRAEQRRNPQTQKQEIFVTDHIGFAIVRRDGRVIIDNTSAFVDTPFPSYMDVAARINQAYIDETAD